MTFPKFQQVHFLSKHKRFCLYLILLINKAEILNSVQISFIFVLTTYVIFLGCRNKEDDLKNSLEVQTEQSSTKNETDNLELDAIGNKTEVELENENKGLRNYITETELENALVKYFEDHDNDTSDTERLVILSYLKGCFISAILCLF